MKLKNIEKTSIFPAQYIDVVDISKISIYLSMLTSMYHPTLPREKYVRTVMESGFEENKLAIFNVDTYLNTCNHQLKV